MGKTSIATSLNLINVICKPSAKTNWYFLALAVELLFTELLKKARRSPINKGNNNEYSLSGRLYKTNTILNLTPPGDQQVYLFRRIPNKIQ